MPRILLLLSALIVFYVPFAQTITGSWYGKADVMIGGSNNNYLTELILRQKGNEVEGIFGYYFKDSYQSFFIRGTYNAKSRQIKINKIPVIFYASTTRDGIECPMDFIGILMVSKVKNTVSGAFYSDDRYKYTCPEIRVNFLLDIKEDQDSVLKTSVTGKKLWQPQQEDFVITARQNEKAKIAVADITPGNTANIPQTLPENTEKQLVEKFVQRKNIYTKDIEVESDSIRISFYDNGDIDGDSISVFLNKKPVLANQELSSRSLNIYLALDTVVEINEISMFADNLGRIPPNTALMIVSDGINRFELYLSSSLTQNGAVRLRRKKKN
ncbi:MAG: hypothetical protein H7122_19750 [Chitinophagaceae bacterium]|nr:hypothetical protein [Chitinophagaceae bacterium]